MNLKEQLETLIQSKNFGSKYIEEAKPLLSELQKLMGSILEAQDMQEQALLQYLIGIVKDTNCSIENQDEVLLRDVLEFGWYRLIMDIMGEDASELV